MRHAASSTSFQSNHLNPRRAATPVIALSAFIAAWVMAASEPAAGEPSVYDLSNGPILVAQAASAQPALQAQQPAPAAERDHPRGTPLYGEISSIEPMKSSPERPGALVGYRVHVRLDSGADRSIDCKELRGLDVGTRVQIQNGSMRPA